MLTIFAQHSPRICVLWMLCLGEGENKTGALDKLEAEPCDTLRFASEKSPSCHEDKH